MFLYFLKRPKIKRYRQHVVMNRNMMLQDDIKEYWGFYLLKGSTVKLSVCSRYEGASFIVVKGLKDARKCAWIGELGKYVQFPKNDHYTPSNKHY